MPPVSRYDYSAAGFDPFLRRSIDTTGKTVLGTQPTQSHAVAFDRIQVTGALGDTLGVGKISLNGADGNIIISDGDNDRLLLGEQDGGF